jgi:hypothetical protein
MRLKKIIIRLTVPLLVALLLLGLALTVMAYTQGASSTGKEAERQALAPTQDLTILYRFSGVTDDGEQGSSSRREATSIHCTNFDPVNNAQVEVQVYQWNGTDVYTGTVNMPPNRTFTFSTQNTTIYFDDVILGGSPGTPAIFQGSGRVLSSHPNVICTAQILDPLNYPPVYASRLPLHLSWQRLFLPLLRQN